METFYLEKYKIKHFIFIFQYGKLNYVFEVPDVYQNDRYKDHK